MFSCLLYTSDAADERSSVDLGGRRIIKKKNKKNNNNYTTIRHVTRLLIEHRTYLQHDLDVAKHYLSQTSVTQ